jgi:hypothetical protein
VAVCRYMDMKELAFWLWVTKIEMLVVMIEYDLTWKGCFAWSTPAWKIAPLRSSVPGLTKKVEFSKKTHSKCGQIGNR